MNRLLFYALVILLFCPLVQRFTKFIHLVPLEGDFVAASKPDFSIKSWKDLTFQGKYDKFINENTGFRDLLVRINNQADFSLFAKANAEGVVVGKEGFLYENDYIRAYLGGDFIGKKNIDKKLRRLKYLQTIYKNMGKDLVLVFEPGRASYYPEYIPGRFLKKYPESLSNYEYFTQRAKELGVTFIDLNRWFKELKPRTKYPLYPKTGVHWSVYGASVAADTLIKFIEQTRKISLPWLTIKNMEFSYETRQTDADAEKTMNLLWGMPHFLMAYPEITFVPSKNDQKPSVLTVADSYYWNIFNMGLPKYCFRNEAFWYFNAKVYPDTYFGEKLTGSLNARVEAEKQDLIFLMVTERFLYKFDWGFLDNLFELYTPELEKDEPYIYENKIRNYSEWFDKIEMSARNSGISFTDAVTANAKYVMFTDEKEKSFLWFGAESYRTMIRNDKHWFEKEEEKARAAGVNTDLIIESDADLMFKNDDPAAWQKYHQLQVIISQLLKDPAMMKAIRDNKYFLSAEDMLWQEAFARLKGSHLLASIM